ncbi:hypothetical protein HK100_000301 [Physocladia obscura]|uniref:Uncharacterized protein n=1 Tax=Physocladia obscura TaxID=109957 RepID=A0AAD5SYN7_9FUNG|nr:hypothetical protein HK100_000301 [Physocladia obscura]
MNIAANKMIDAVETEADAEAGWQESEANRINSNYSNEMSNNEYPASSYVAPVSSFQAESFFFAPPNCSPLQLPNAIKVNINTNNETAKPNANSTPKVTSNLSSNTSASFILSQPNKRRPSLRHDILTQTHRQSSRSLSTSISVSTISSSASPSPLLPPAMSDDWLRDIVSCMGKIELENPLYETMLSVSPEPDIDQASEQTVTTPPLISAYISQPTDDILCSDSNFSPTKSEGISDDCVYNSNATCSAAIFESDQLKFDVQYDDASENTPAHSPVDERIELRDVKYQISLFTPQNLNCLPVSLIQRPYSKKNKPKLHEINTFFWGKNSPNISPSILSPESPSDSLSTNEEATKTPIKRMLILAVDKESEESTMLWPTNRATSIPVLQTTIANTKPKRRTKHVRFSKYVHTKALSGKNCVESLDGISGTLKHREWRRRKKETERLSALHEARERAPAFTLVEEFDEELGSDVDERWARNSGNVSPLISLATGVTNLRQTKGLLENVCGIFVRLFGGCFGEEMDRGEVVSSVIMSAPTAITPLLRPDAIRTSTQSYRSFERPSFEGLFHFEDEATDKHLNAKTNLLKWSDDESSDDDF